MLKIAYVPVQRTLGSKFDAKVRCYKVLNMLLSLRLELFSFVGCLTSSQGLSKAYKNWKFWLLVLKISNIKKVAFIDLHIERKELRMLKDVIESEDDKISRGMNKEIVTEEKTFIMLCKGLTILWNQLWIKIDLSLVYSYDETAMNLNVYIVQLLGELLITTDIVLD